MAQACEAGEAADPAEWSGLLSRVGWELRTLAAAVGDLQGFITPLVGGMVERDPAALVRLQDLDRLEQSLHGLSDLMSCLDGSVVVTDPDALRAGVEMLRLADMARRLGSAGASAGGLEPEGSALDLF